MRSFQRKRGFKDILQSRPVLAFLIVLLLIFAWGVAGFMRKMQVTVENRKISENKVLELQQEKDKLSSDISKLKTDSGVEESIRDKFGLAKDGEGEIVITEDKNSPQPPKQESKGFFSFFANLFK